MNNRVIIIFVMAFAAWAGILFRAGYLQLFPNARLQSLQQRQFTKSMTLQARRGAIYDRNGKELAVSVPSFSIFADPSGITQISRTANALARVLKIPERSLRKKILESKQDNRRFLWIRRNLNERQKQEVLALHLKGIHSVEEPKRVYPNNELGAQILGFVGQDGKGLEGIELQFDALLRGETRKYQVQRDAKGRPLLIDGRVFMDHPDGWYLTLTIDQELQFVLEQELDKAKLEFNADSAFGIIMDPKTGDILSMAHAPAFDLNTWRDYSSSLRRNRLVNDAFEPGSTMKTFVVAGALRDGTLKPNSKYNCEGGKFKVGDKIIREAEANHKFGLLTVTEILSLSSNVGMTKIAFDMTSDRVYKTLVDFGFGGETGIDLPGEARGILRPPYWNPHLLSNISFGHGMTATPIQVVTAYAAIANGGTLLKPRLLKSIKNSETEEIKTFETQSLRQVLNRAQADTMKLMLMAATSDSGTGANARIPGFPVAGKTGTAQKVDLEKGGYKKDSYISSFAGFVPTHDPRFVIYVVVDNPKTSYYGSQVAAPVFAKVASFAMRKEGIAPVFITEKNLLHGSKVADLNQQKNLQTRQMQSIDRVRRKMETPQKDMPNLVGLTLREAIDQLREKDIRLQIKGAGVITKTWPQAGEEIPVSRKVHLELR